MVCFFSFFNHSDCLCRCIFFFWGFFFVNTIYNLFFTLVSISCKVIQNNITWRKQGPWATGILLKSSNSKLKKKRKHMNITSDMSVQNNHSRIHVSLCIVGKWVPYLIRLFPSIQLRTNIGSLWSLVKKWPMRNLNFSYK